MSEVQETIEIKATPEEVWDLVMDPHRLAEWVTIHRKLGKVDGGPPRVGYRMEQTMTIRGAAFKVKWLLAECEPARRASWEGRGPAGSVAHTSYDLEPHDGGTRFHYRNDFRAPLGPLGAVASRTLVGDIPAREAHRTLAQLKRLLEDAKD